MKTVRINRKRWGQSLLRETIGKNAKLCCLGFVCEAYGVPKSATHNKPMPIDMDPEVCARLPRWLTKTGDITDTKMASSINDDPRLSWSEKEKRLKPLFLKHGIRLIFEGTRG